MGGVTGFFNSRPDDRNQCLLCLALGIKLAGYIWGCSSVWLEYRPVTPRVASSSLVIPARLSRIIHEAVPEITETIHFDLPWFVRHGRVCYIRGLRDSVALSFQAGALLTDPGGMLEGTGKFMRHIKVRSTDYLDREQIKAWVVQAVGLNISDKDQFETLVRESASGHGDE